ncbi:MAG: hypothetical protein NXH97_13700 [Rhodobacteraceae bacterium]|nr:hypothetical protein [Paracoccaceae bacterium]
MAIASRRKMLAGAGLLALATVVIAQDETYGFMPDGGRTILVQVLGDETLSQVASTEQSEEAWQAWGITRAPDLNPAELETLAGYAALNFPLTPDRIAQLSDSGDAALLPQDGRDLAIAQCQFCHSMFTGYLMHDRDETGWKGTFKAPFHQEIPMTETERDTFARYSAINMPLRVEDVPPELRF